MNRWMESFGSCNAHLVAPAGCRVVWIAQHSVLSPSTQGGFLSGVLKVTKGKWEIKHSQRDNGDKPSAKWLMWYLDTQLKSSHTPRAISLSLWSRKTENTLFISPITDRRGWDGPSGPAISKEVCCSRRGRRVSSFPPPRGSRGPPRLPRCRFRSPQSVKPRVGSESSCRVGSPRVKTYSCTATTEALAGSLMKWEKTRCPAARRTTCEIQHAPRMGSQAKANRTLWPSPPGTWAPGVQPSKQAHPSLKHRSKAWVQGPHQACFLASPGATPGPTLGPVEREKGLRVLLASQFPVGSLCRPQLYIH